MRRHITLGVLLVVAILGGACGRVAPSPNVPVLINRNDPDSARILTAARDSSGTLVTELGTSGTQLWAVPSNEMSGFSARTGGLASSGFEAINPEAPILLPDDSADMSSLTNLQRQALLRIVGGAPPDRYRVTANAKPDVGPFLLGYRTLSESIRRPFPTDLAETLSLHLVGDRYVTLRQVDVERRGDNDFTWRGAIANGGRATLSVAPGAMTGTLVMPDATFNIAPVVGGLQVIYAGTVDRPDEPDVAPAPQRGGGGGRGGRGGALGVMSPGLPAVAAIPPPSAAVCPTDQGDVIDVLFVYSPAVAPYFFASDSQHAVDSVNDAYAESRLTARVNKVSDVQWTGFKEADLVTDLAALRANAFVKQQRNQLAADVVVAVVDEPTTLPLERKPCGYAGTLAPPLDHAVALVEIGCLASLSTAHEIGHLLGAAHEPPDHQVVPFNYAHGFVDTNQAWRTVMATNARCAKCPRVALWSNPAIQYPNDPQGRPAGVSNISEDWRVARDRSRVLATARCR